VNQLNHEGHEAAMLKSFILFTAAFVALAADTRGETPVVAVISATEGKVLINHGRGFVTAGPQAPLFPGDRILVGNDGAATVVYNSGTCSLALNANSLVQVAAKARCKDGAAVAMSEQVLVSPAAYSGGLEGSTASRLWVLGGLTVVAGVVAVVAAGYDDPAPPVPVSKP
jgi:hypothetical protein